jgi:Sigma-54 interaction domain
VVPFAFGDFPGCTWLERYRSTADATGMRRSVDARSLRFHFGLSPTTERPLCGAENVVIREEIDKASMFEEIVGASNPLKAVLSGIAKVAPTGFARAVHKRSRRAGCIFVSVNCAALAPTLVSSVMYPSTFADFTKYAEFAIFAKSAGVSRPFVISFQYVENGRAPASCGFEPSGSEKGHNVPCP